MVTPEHERGRGVSSEAEISIVENENRNSRLISLGEILKNRFIIPVYQRPYSWSSENFKDLLTTIRELVEGKIYQHSSVQ